MPFQPLGYRFELTTLLFKEAAITAIRENKGGWYASEGVARGWVFGSFLCLWQSALNEHGPMVLARIASDGFRTRIVGRAGADLNGTLLFLIAAPLLVWLTWKMHETGQGDTRSFVIIGLLVGVGLPLTLWVNSKDRRQADSLVRFISEAVNAEPRIT